MTYNKEYIGERIQRKRNSLNITQEQLAEMINTSKNTISNVESKEEEIFIYVQPLIGVALNSKKEPKYLKLIIN